MLEAPGVETVKSYNIDFTSFEKSFRALLKRASCDLFAKPPRRGGEKEELPEWAAYAKTTLTAIDRNAGLIDAFKTRVVEFFENHTEALVAPISDEDGHINDSFLKRKDAFAAPPHSGDLGAGLSRVAMEGPVVFFSPDNATVYSVCLPIGEIYRASIAEHMSASETNVHRRLFPTLTLLDWCAMLYHALPEASPHKEALAQNVIDMCDFAEKQAPDTGPGPAESEGQSSAPQLDALGMMSSVMSLLSSPNAGGLTGTVDKFKDVLGSIFEKVKVLDTTRPGETPNIAAFVGNLGQALQSPELQQKVSSFSTDAFATLGALGMMPSAASPPAGDLQQIASQ